ncbi:MAG: beta strand repeat-containing protein [Spongiibacter marinus]|uniref:beta strand repeat-containing protein n=1 Tax=Spongiibacter marinus TaxID=354246 RepID=UPI003C648A05
MKKQGTREQITVDVDTTAVDTLSAELAAAVAPQAELETAPVEGLFDDEKKLEEEVALSEGAIQTEAVEVAAADNGVAAMILADTNAQSSGGASTGGSSGGSVPTGVWIGAGVLGAAAIVAASDDDDDDNGGSKSSTPANRAPEAAASQAVSVDEGDSTVISINATDADGDSLTYSPTQPANGQLAVNGSNQFTYTPDAGFSGTDSFDVVISDGKTSITQTVNITVDPAGNGGTPGAYQLTSGTDVATADVFDAPMVFTPDGSDRILSLQDEDVLTGTAGKTDNTLNVTMGHPNRDEGTSGVVTPNLINIQNINIDWTGSTRTLDLRNSDSTEKVNVERVTQDAGAVTVDNISTPVADLRVSNTASQDVNVNFMYKQGVLTGDDTLKLELDDVLANRVTQNARGTGGSGTREGFESVNLVAQNGVDLNLLSINEMESLTIEGSGDLHILNLRPLGPGGATEYQQIGFGGAAIATPGSIGIRSIDGSAFTGDMELDITSAVNGFTDPSDSGKTVHTNIKGGDGDDAFYTTRAISATTTGAGTVRDVIDGGAGSNKIVTTSNIASNPQGETAAITNVQALEMRQQGGAQTVDFDAFDSTLTSVLMRGESGGGAVFTLNDVGAALALNGLQLNHGITGATNPTVNVMLKDASGASDTVAITIEDDLNSPNPDSRGNNVFGFNLNIDGDNGDGNTIKNDGRVENVTIIDNDVETNTVTFGANVAEHSGTIKLSGGEAGDQFTVTNTLTSAVVDGSAQASDLGLTVGVANQDIRLGTGNDVLTFSALDGFNSLDKISDAGGNDTVRASFSKDGALDLAGIENLHIVATEKVALDMAKADVQNLVIMGSNAVDKAGVAADNAAEPFGIAGGLVAPVDVITLSNTKLSVLNFSADLDTDNDNTAANRAAAEAAAAADPKWTGIGTSAAGDAAYKAVINDESPAAVFNGVELANNTGDALTVNINSGLDDVIFGATSYTLGQLTAHGVKTMDINVTDEDRTFGAANANTTIQNIFGKDLAALTVTAQDNVNLGTVSGGALNNSLKTLDATSVGGNFTANAIALGDGAQVRLGGGNDVFSAFGSAGKGINIDAGNGSNNVTGSAQNDTITTGSGRDTIDGGRGDNVMFSGAGDDMLSAKFGNDIYSVGTGFDKVFDNSNSGNAATTATNTVVLDGGGITTVHIDVDGDNTTTGVAPGLLAGTEVDQVLAVGAGSTLNVSWIGDDIQAASAVLDGRLAVVDGPAAAVTTDNSDLFIQTNATNLVVGASKGNDVAILTETSTGTLTFNGGAGNDAAVGGRAADTFTGGVGADKLVMQNTLAADNVQDTVVIADGDSTAAAYDQVFGFQEAGAATEDTLDLASVAIANATPASVGAQTDVNVGSAKSISVNATGLVEFDNTEVFAGATQVGAGGGQISLQDALGYLAANLNNSGQTVAFTYDANGNGVLEDGIDSVFVFQDGGNDTVVELVGYDAVAAPGDIAALAGLETGANAANLINIS